MTDPVSDRFATEMFPQKVAMLWNHILVEPYAERPGMGAMRMGRHTAQTYTRIQHLVLAHERYSAGLLRGVDSVETLRAWTAGLKGPRVLATVQDWADLFVFVSTSGFLMGSKNARRRTGWRVSLPWVLEAGNLSKVSMGAYHSPETMVRASRRTEVPREFDGVLLQAYSPFRLVEGS